ncbi:MAG: LptF/LptG family permease [Chitinophagaceae bacterium]
MLSRLDRYILKQFLLTFLLLLVAFVVIAIVIDFTEKINDFVNKKVPTKDILLYFKNFVPYIVALLFPIFIFVSVIYFTSKLANKSEIIAMLSSGMNFSRFLRPYFIGAGILSVFLFIANHYIIPKANRSKNLFEEKYMWNTAYSSDDNFHMRIKPNEYIYMQSYNPQIKTGFRFSFEKVKGNLLLEKITADRIVFDTVKKSWDMHDVIIRTNDSIKEHLEKHIRYTKQFNFKPEDLIERREGKFIMTTKELNTYITKEKNKGSENLNEYYIEKYRRTAAPFSAFILSIIGACIASRKVRGGSGIHLFIGVMLSAIYIFLMQALPMFSIKGGLQPLLAVWVPNILFSVIALFVYFKFSK